MTEMLVPTRYVRPQAKLAKLRRELLEPKGGGGGGGAGEGEQPRAARWGAAANAAVAGCS